MKEPATGSSKGKKRLKRCPIVNGKWMQKRWGIGPEEGQRSWFDNLLIEKKDVSGTRPE